MDGVWAYKENSVTTQTPGRLIVMLYEGAIRFLAQAADALEAGDHERKAESLHKAQAIIDELNVSLDVEGGGKVAANLRELYVFMTRHLDGALVRQDPSMIREVIALLEDLNEGWKAVAL